MSTVVWLMYLADLAGNLQQLFLAVGIGGLFVCAFIAFVTGMSNDEIPKFRTYRSYVIACAISTVLGAAMPSQNTIYAAAAVTAGEKALNTPTGGKAVRALNAWLDRQIDGKGDK